MGMAYLLLKDTAPTKPLYLILFLSISITLGFLAYDRVVTATAIKSGKHLSDDTFITRWHLRYLINLGLVGLIWGSFAIFFIEPIRGDFFDLSQQFAPIAIYVSAIITVGSLAIALGIVPCVFISFALGAMFPYLGILLLHPTLHYQWMGYGAIIYLIAVFYLLRLTYQRSINTLTLQHKNTVLQDHLEAESHALTKASIDKSLFLATASHDLKQPLHTSILLLGILQEELTTEKQKKRLENLKQAIEAQTKLLSSLLNISQLDAGIVKAHPTHLPLNDILLVMRNEFKPEAATQRRELVIDTTNVTVITDKILLERILRNLLTNAFCHTKSCAIKLGINQKSDHIEVYVSDSGSGISDQQADHIYAKFKRSNNAERGRYEGTGLGLSIVKRLCDLLNHSITLSLMPNVSTCFTIKIPYGQADKVSLNLPDKPTDLGFSIAGRHIMVIDDEKGTIDAMRVVVKKWSCQFSYAYSVNEALALIDAGEVPDLLIADYLLANDETGLDCIKAVRLALMNDTPALIITGNTDPKMLALIKSYGLHFLNKPVNLAQLRVAVIHLLKSS